MELFFCGDGVIAVFLRDREVRGALHLSSQLCLKSVSALRTGCSSGRPPCQSRRIGLALPPSDRELDVTKCLQKCLGAIGSVLWHVLSSCLSPTRRQAFPACSL